MPIGSGRILDLQFPFFPTEAVPSRIYCFQQFSLIIELQVKTGLITLVGKNIFAEEFGFQDTDPGDPRIFPDRLVLLKLSVFF